MLDPQAECPDCGARLGGAVDCRKCGWTPKAKTTTPTARNWGPTPYTPPTAEEHERIKGMIAELTAKLGAAAEPARRTSKEYGMKRATCCDTGNFVHMGVRYCLQGYLGQHR